MIAVEETFASQRRRSIAIYAVIVVALTVSAVASAWQGVAVISDIRMQDRVASVIKQSDALLLAIEDAETGQRGFLLTGDEKYLQPYFEGKRVAARAVGDLIDSVHTLSPRNPRWQLSPASPIDFDECAKAENAPGGMLSQSSSASREMDVAQRLRSE